MGTHAAAPFFYPNLGYDPQKDFEPIGLIAEQPELLTVRKDFPANNLKEFVAYAKANESKLNMGHAGVGSVSYVGCLLLNSAIGIKPTMVPFTGTAPVMNAILAGQIDYDCDPVLGPLPHVLAGNAKALAIAAKKAQSVLPDVPTSYEQGLPQFDCAPFYAVFAPKGTPQAIVDKLAGCLSKGLSEEAVQKRLAALGAEIAEPDRRGSKSACGPGQKRSRSPDADPEGRVVEVGLSAWRRYRPTSPGRRATLCDFGECSDFPTSSPVAADAASCSQAADADEVAAASRATSSTRPAATALSSCRLCLFEVLRPHADVGRVLCALCQSLLEFLHGKPAAAAPGARDGLNWNRHVGKQNGIRNVDLVDDRVLVRIVGDDQHKRSKLPLDGIDRHRKLHRGNRT
jgi:hypothetical protein